VGELEVALSELKPRAIATRGEADKTRQALAGRRSRLQALEDLHQRLDGVDAGTKHLLASGDPAVRGMVADHVEVPEAYSTAFASLLGDRLQAIVVQAPEEALRLLDQLRDGTAGRAAIASRTPFGLSQAVETPAAADPRVLGRLIDEIRFGDENAALMHGLVGEALVVRSAADALEIVAAYPDATVVALDGTVAGPDGVVRGGSAGAVQSSLLDQKREMADLRERVAALELEAAAQQAANAALDAKISAEEAALDAARRAAHQSEVAFLVAEKDLVRTEADLARATRRQAELSQELLELEQKAAGTATERAACEASVTELTERITRITAALADGEREALIWKERAAAQATLVTDRRVNLARVREQLGAARAATERVQGTVVDLRERASRLEKELLETTKLSGETAAQLMLYRDLGGSAREAALIAHRELEEVRQLLEQIRVALSAREATLREFRDVKTVTDQALRKHEMDLQKLEIERDHLLQSVRERFRGLDLSRVVGDYHARPAPDAEHRRRIDELTKLIDRMGPVNLDAQAEYHDAETRFGTLSAQKLDIEDGLDKLMQAIRHMDRESKKRFRETFDSVNELFRNTFTQMFKGGRAELRLTNPDDLLETGVEIVAQPPGKKLANIELMSGGEKALTATSLIFAIFRHRPSPFCVLDEVDAPLDDANVTRYCEAIRSMTSRSQFILITHIKKTMSEVDVLYGVTMAEPGVSRLVSVKVNSEAVARSDRATNALATPDASEIEAAQTQVA
jgi:chromosome segregation protein